VNNGT